MPIVPEILEENQKSLEINQSMSANETICGYMTLANVNSASINIQNQEISPQTNQTAKIENTRNQSDYVSHEVLMSQHQTTQNVKL